MTTRVGTPAPPSPVMREVSRVGDRPEVSVVTPLAPADAAIFETFVVPRYLRHFADLALEMIVPPGNPGDAVLAHLGCRTGFPDRQLVELLGPLRLVGTDPSPAGLELARAKAATINDLSADYRVFEGFPSPLPEAQFTHALALHPPGRSATRVLWAREAHRVLVPGGNFVMSLPLRGSFAEIADLLREYALKSDNGKAQEAIDAAVNLRPSPEQLGDELETLGFEDVDVDFRVIGVPFQSGRDLIEDPTTRLLLFPEWRMNLGFDESTMQSAFSYLREAVDRYWAEGGFELTLHVGCARAFRSA